MKLLSLLTTAALTLPSTLAISTQLLKNYCNETLYVTLVLGNGQTEDGSFELPPSEAFIHPINGTGNAAKIGFQPAIFDPNVGVFIFGTSVSNGELFWGVSYANSDPFANTTWSVTSSGTVDDVCNMTSAYDGAVHACADNDVTLTLAAC